MELLDELKGFVEKQYNDLQEYTSIYNQETTNNRNVVFEEAKAKFAEDPESVNLEEIARDTLFLGSFQQTDIRRLQSRLLMAYGIYREFGGEDLFSDEIEKAVQFLKASLPKPLFVPKNGKLEEIEKGRVDELKKQYEDRGMFKMFEPTLRQLMNE